jgi:hypothetical protein
MQDFPPNSQKAKATDAPREKVEPVTSAKTGGRKKAGLGRRFKETFFDGTSRGAAEHAVTDVIVPSIRDMLFEAFQGALDHLFYGDRSGGGGRRRTTSSSIVSQGFGRVPYESISTPTRATQQSARTLSRQSRARHSLEELIIPTRDEANQVIDRMYDILSQQGDVTVADLYALTGVRPDHTDNKWGWYNLKGSKAVRLRQGGYLLDLPEPEPLG